MNFILGRCEHVENTTYVTIKNLEVTVLEMNISSVYPTAQKKNRP